MEHKILAALARARKNFERIDPHLSSEDVSPEGALILKRIRQFYYNDTKAPSADMDIVRNQVLRSVQNPKHKELFEVYFRQMAEQEVSDVNVVAEVMAAKRDVIEMSLAEAILAKDSVRKDTLIERLSSLRMDEDLEGAVHEEYQGLDADSLVEAFDTEHLIRVAPPSLNSRLKGGALPGHHLVIVAYPEVGKTLLALTMLSGFVHQGLKSLYVGNEDPIKSIIKRFVSNLSRRTFEQIDADPQGSVALARRHGYDRAVFAGLNGGTLEDIRSLVAKHRPRVLIVDQIRNITAGAENRTQQLETVARGMRNIAREYDLLAVSITQGADSARGKLQLDMGDVDGSNVGIPGTADVMVMIGMTETYDAENRRVITLAKNKIGGIHDHWPIGIRREYSSFVDFGGQK